MTVLLEHTNLTQNMQTALLEYIGVSFNIGEMYVHCSISSTRNAVKADIIVMI